MRATRQYKCVTLVIVDKKVIPGLGRPCFSVTNALAYQDDEKNIKFLPVVNVDISLVNDLLVGIL